MNKVQAKEIVALLIVGSAELEAGAPLICFEFPEGLGANLCDVIF